MFKAADFYLFLFLKEDCRAKYIIWILKIWNLNIWKFVMVVMVLVMDVVLVVDEDDRSENSIQLWQL